MFFQALTAQHATFFKTTTLIFSLKFEKVTSDRAYRHIGHDLRAEMSCLRRDRNPGQGRRSPTRQRTLFSKTGNGISKHYQTSGSHRRGQRKK